MRLNDERARALPSDILSSCHFLRISSKVRLPYALSVLMIQMLWFNILAVFMWSKLQKTSQFTKKMTKNSIIFLRFLQIISGRNCYPDTTLLTKPLILQGLTASLQSSF
jgi:hypothetical protein